MKKKHSCLLFLIQSKLIMNEIEDCMIKKIINCNMVMCDFHIENAQI